MHSTEHNPYDVLTSYELRHLQNHVAIVNPGAVLSEITPGFVQAKVSLFHSVTPVLDDFFLAIRISTEQNDFITAYKFTFLRNILADQGWSEFSGTLDVLRTRMGDYNSALEDVNTLGDHNDRILVRAERFVQLFGSKLLSAEADSFEI